MWGAEYYHWTHAPWADIDGLVQNRFNSSALAMELCFCCTNPSIWFYGFTHAFKTQFWLHWSGNIEAAQCGAVLLHIVNYFNNSAEMLQ